MIVLYTMMKIAYLVSQLTITKIISNIENNIYENGILFRLGLGISITLHVTITNCYTILYIYHKSWLYNYMVYKRI